MIRSRILLNKSTNEQKARETPVNGKQKNDFEGTAKKRKRKNKVAQHSLVPVESKETVSDSNNNNQPEFESVASVKKFIKSEPTIYQRPTLNDWN
jgi:hypothetical protein